MGTRREQKSKDKKMNYYVARQITSIKIDIIQIFIIVKNTKF